MNIQGKINNYEEFCKVVKTESDNSNNEKKYVDKIINFFINNAEYLKTSPFRDHELGDDILKISRKIRRTYPNEIKIKNNDIREIVKKIEIFGFTNKVSREESLGNFKNRNALSFFLVKINPKEYKKLSLVSKEWKKTVQIPYTKINSINNNPETPIKKLFNNYTELKNFIFEYGEKITALNLIGIDANNLEKLKELMDSCPNIKHLSVGVENHTDTGKPTFSQEAFLEIIKHPSLESLSIQDSSALKEEDLTQLKELKNLKSLTLTLCPYLTDKVLKNNEFPQLVMFSISENDTISGEGISCLSKLQTLELCDCSVGDNFFSELAKIPPLRILDLDYCSVINADFVNLSELKNLETISLKYTRISKKDLVDIENAPRLKPLNIIH